MAPRDRQDHARRFSVGNGQTKPVSSHAEKARRKPGPLYCTNPSSNTDQWFVWDIYSGLPPKPVFFGTMEDAGLVADTLNAHGQRPLK